jgi:hypothetical protein
MRTIQKLMGQCGIGTTALDRYGMSTGRCGIPSLT